MTTEWPPKDLIQGLALNTDHRVEEVLDENVAAALPPSIKVLSITPSGSSAWVQTVRIDTEQQNGIRRSYFKKSQSGPTAKRMMRGTYESEHTFFDYAPKNVPRPLAWGEYKSDPNTYFYLAEFHNMVDKVPDPHNFVSTVVKIHKSSMGKAPGGRFGFHVPTHLANIANDNRWQSSWEAWYTTAMHRMFELEERSHGKNEEFEHLRNQLFQKVIPRLLRPLESEGRKVIPCLIHSDLWPGNCMPDADTDKIMLFDSCAYWGHNESDLGSWRAPRYRMGSSFLEQYQEQMGMSMPEEDWDDRNALYALRYDLLVSALFPNSKAFRSLAMQEMRRLCEKYPAGFDGYYEQTDQTFTVVE